MLWGQPEYRCPAFFRLFSGAVGVNPAPSSAVAVFLKAEQDHNSCEMYLDEGRMIYVMNHDKHDEFMSWFNPSWQGSSTQPPSLTHLPSPLVGWGGE